MRMFSGTWSAAANNEHGALRLWLVHFWQVGTGPFTVLVTEFLKLTHPQRWL